jgi:hypothetical protein
MQNLEATRTNSPSFAQKLLSKGVKIICAGLETTLSPLNLSRSLLAASLLTACSPDSDYFINEGIKVDLPDTRDTEEVEEEDPEEFINEIEDCEWRDSYEEGHEIGLNDNGIDWDGDGFTNQQELDPLVCTNPHNFYNHSPINLKITGYYQIDGTMIQGDSHQYINSPQNTNEDCFYDNCELEQEITPWENFYLQFQTEYNGPSFSMLFMDLPEGFRGDVIDVYDCGGEDESSSHNLQQYDPTSTNFVQGCTNRSQVITDFDELYQLEGDYVVEADLYQAGIDAELYTDGDPFGGGDQVIIITPECDKDLVQCYPSAEISLNTPAPK